MVTHHKATKLHLPYEITHAVLPATRHW